MKRKTLGVLGLIAAVAVGFGMGRMVTTITVPSQTGTVTAVGAIGGPDGPFHLVATPGGAGKVATVEIKHLSAADVAPFGVGDFVVISGLSVTKP